MDTQTATALIVEDDAAVSRALSRAVRSFGFHVAVFGDGESVLASEIDQAPALLLLDLHLPGIAGAELIRELLLRAPQLRIVVMTGRDITGAREACLAAGAKTYIHKPISRADLAALLSG